MENEYEKKSNDYIAGWYGGPSEREINLDYIAGQWSRKSSDDYNKSMKENWDNACSGGGGLGFIVLFAILALIGMFAK